MNPADLTEALSESIHPVLARQLMDEAISLEEAFALRRWKNTELDGGRFVEVAARILYLMDSGNLALTKGVDDCLRYIDNQQVPHLVADYQAVVHISKVIRAVYKLRSQRGAVHVSPTYTANEIDSRLILECVRWCLADILRLFGGFPQDVLVETVRSLARFPQPLIRMFGDKALLQSISFTTEEEILAHLLFSDAGMTIVELVSVVPKDPSGVRRAVARLESARCRQIVRRENRVLITDLGIGRIQEKVDGIAPA